MNPPSSDIDQLELELRSIPGVVSVGVERQTDSLLLQVVALASVSPPDVRTRVRRAVEIYLAEPTSLELVIDTVEP